MSKSNTETFLGRAAILEKEDLARERVPVPEWGGHVFIQAFSATDRDAFEKDMVDTTAATPKNNLENFRARLVCRTCVDEKGNKIFAIKDIPALGKKSAKALSRLYDVATRLNGIGVKDVEDLTKN